MSNDDTSKISNNVVNPHVATHDSFIYEDVVDKPISTVIDKLSGQQKVAAILVAMGKETATKLLRHFTPEDLRLLSGQAQTLPTISSADFEYLVRCFEDSFAEGATFSEAGQRFKKLIIDTLSEDEAADILNPKSTSAKTNESIWQIMGRMTPDKLYSYIKNEHPQVVAFILSKIPNELAARFLLLNEPEVRSEIIKRHLHLKKITANSEKLLEISLNSVFLIQTEDGDATYHGQVASILNQLSKTDIDQTLQNLEKLSPEDVESIKARIFVFDDIIQLTDKARLLLFNDIPIDITVLALRRANAALTECILNALSPRSRRMAETELSTPDDQFQQNEIEDARRFISQEAIKLSEAGKIDLHTSNETSS